MLRGSVPGAKGGFVLVSDSKKSALPKETPFPAALVGKGKEAKDTFKDEGADSADEEQVKDEKK